MSISLLSIFTSSGVSPGRLSAAVDACELLLLGDGGIARGLFGSDGVAQLAGRGVEIGRHVHS